MEQANRKDELARKLNLIKLEERAREEELEWRRVLSYRTDGAKSAKPD